MNRRNAVIGWATWTVLKQVLKRNAKADAEAADEEARQSRRWRRGAPEEEPEPKKKRSKRRVIGFLAACAVGVGVWLGTRRQGDDEPVE